jgi:hydrogenase expression/formation protein HypC
MCLAVPAQVVDCSGDEATVDLQGSSLRVSTIMTPGVGRGDWVLVHAGFAITQLDEADARETWDYLRQAFPELLEPGPDSEVKGGGP